MHSLCPLLLSERIEHFHRGRIWRKTTSLHIRKIIIYILTLKQSSSILLLKGSLWPNNNEAQCSVSRLYFLHIHIDIEKVQSYATDKCHPFVIIKLICFAIDHHESDACPLASSLLMHGMGHSFLLIIAN